MAERPPTSHERLSGRPWDASYRDGPAPWDIGHPQPAVVRLAAAGAFSGSVLDAGCGTGENALHIASFGLQVLGVDVAPTALAMAREKAAGVNARFEECDALHLERLGRVFDTVLDCALFHAFDSDERPPYVKSLAAATAPGARLHLLCFSDVGAQCGPHPVAEDELRAAFAAGWRIDSLTPELLESRFAPQGAPAWLLAAERS